LKFIIPLLVALSQWQSYQTMRGVFTSNTVTPEYYLASFFDAVPDSTKKHLLAFSHDEFFEKGIQSIPKGYEFVGEFVVSSPNEIIPLKGRRFTDGFRIPFKELCPGDHCFIEVNLTLLGEIPENAMTVMTMERKEGNYHYQADLLKESIVEHNSRDSTSIARTFYLTPPIRDEDDMFVTYVWNRNMDSGKLISYKFKVYAPGDS
jgi:hypothetical protein